MPLSKARNRERMRKTRLHKRLSSLTESKPVQPKRLYPTVAEIEEQKRLARKYNLDADGNAMPELS